MLVESEVGLSTRHVLQEISAKEMGMGICKEYRKRCLYAHHQKASLYTTKAQNRDRKELTGNSLSNSQNTVLDLCKCQGKGQKGRRAQM